MGIFCSLVNLLHRVQGNKRRSKLLNRTNNIGYEYGRSNVVSYLMRKSMVWYLQHVLRHVTDIHAFLSSPSCASALHLPPPPSPLSHLRIVTSSELKELEDDPEMLIEYSLKLASTYLGIPLFRFKGMTHPLPVCLLCFDYCSICLSLAHSTFRMLYPRIPLIPLLICCVFVGLFVWLFVYWFVWLFVCLSVCRCAYGRNRHDHSNGGSFNVRHASVKGRKRHTWHDEVVRRTVPHDIGDVVLSWSIKLCVAGGSRGNNMGRRNCSFSSELFIRLSWKYAYPIFPVPFHLSCLLFPSFLHRYVVLLIITWE